MACHLNRCHDVLMKPQHQDLAAEELACGTLRSVGVDLRVVVVVHSFVVDMVGCILVQYMEHQVPCYKRLVQMLHKHHVNVAEVDHKIHRVVMGQHVDERWGHRLLVPVQMLGQSAKLV